MTQLKDGDNYQLTPVYTRLNEAFGGFYEALPPHYNRNKRYPLLLFLHGQGQMGNGNEHLKYLLYDGIGKWLSDNRLPSHFTIDHNNVAFITVIPQYSRPPSVEELMECVNYFEKIYLVDSTRIYMSGLSLGARTITKAAAVYPERFAAIVPISGVSTEADFDMRCRQIADGKLPVWELHNQEDPLADVEDAKLFIDCIKEADPGAVAKITIFDKYGHDAWTAALNPEFRENGQNIYEWMLSYSR